MNLPGQKPTLGPEELSGELFDLVLPRLLSDARAADTLDFKVDPSVNLERKQPDVGAGRYAS